MDSTERFTSRVDDYIKYRPSYPREIVDLLASRYSLKPAAVIADVGSGTGILSALFLDAGFKLLCIEPNDAMRNAAEAALGDRENFKSLNATAEQTTLEENSVDLIIAGQAFHWFDPVVTRKEFARIGKAQCPTALIWNDRIIENDPFHIEYEALLQKRAPNYPSLHHHRIGEKEIAAFFAPASFKLDSFPNEQIFDFAGLLGRLDSSSYAPNPGDEHYEPMRQDLRDLFDRYQKDGKVVVKYNAKVYHGMLTAKD